MRKTIITAKELNELERYASLDYTEVGEELLTIISLINGVSLSDECRNFLKKEAKEYLDMYKKDCVIKQKQVLSQTIGPVLEWKNQ